MTIRHHPIETRLLDYAAGTLDAGQRLLVGAHLESCPSCRRTVAMLERVGGSLLTDLSPTPMAPGARERAIARLQSAESAARVAHRPLNDMADLPPALRNYELSRWHWSGPGVRWRSLALPEESASRVFLLKVQPGTKLPQHTHSETELTLVLKGSFSHKGGRFERGDFDDADGSVDHQPTVDSEQECICLVAMQGNLQFKGLLGRIMQPFVRF